MSDTQEKDNSAPSPVLDSQKTFSPYQNTPLFKDNEGFLFVFKKSQKLASAIYLVTDTLPSEERLRRDLRELSVSLVKDIVTIASIRQVSLLVSRVLEILSLLEVSSGARLVSPMNAALLKREYEGLLEVIGKNEQRLAVPAVSLDEKSLTGDTPSLGVAPVELSAALRPAARFPGTQNPPSSMGHKGHNPSPIQGRSASILEFLKSSGNPVSIKDIAAHIRGVGEKTIQRELGALVAQGVLKREGERRWSRYSMAGRTHVQP